MSHPAPPAAGGPSLAPVVVAWCLAATGVAAAATGLLLDSADDGLIRWKWLILAVVLSLPGALIAAARPRALLGWLLIVVALGVSLTGLAQSWVRDAGAADHPLTAFAVWYADRFGAIVVPIAVVALMNLPDSRLPTPRWRGPVAVVVLVQVVLVVAWSFSATSAAAPESAWPEEIAALDNPVAVLPPAWADAVAGLAWVLTLPMLLCVAAMAVRLRRSRGADRARLSVLLLALCVLVGALLGGQALGTPLREVVELLGSLFFGLVLVSAVLRRQLEGVSLVVHHAFVFTALGAIVVGVYVLSVGALAATGPELSRFGGGVVAACAALVVQPLRTRLHRWVDRLMYGDRRDPFAAVSRLAEKAHPAPSLEEVLLRVAESVAVSLRVPEVMAQAFGVRATYPAEGMGAAATDPGGRGSGPLVRVPLAVGAREIGSLAVGTLPGRRLGRDEQRLLEELGRHAGVAADAVHLAEQVAEHHRSLVAAREEERRRLGRELHDDLGPTVAGLSMQLGALRPLVHRDPAAVVARLARLEEAAAGALAAIRRVAHELRPPVLDQVGLGRAVLSVAESLELSVADPVVDHGSLPAAVELAAYRIAAEALTNVARHAGTTTVRVEVRQAGDNLILIVADDGCCPGAGTLPAAGEPGLGITTMSERAEELGGTLTVRSAEGGGTVVTAVVPLGMTPTFGVPVDDAAMVDQR